MCGDETALRMAPRFEVRLEILRVFPFTSGEGDPRAFGAAREGVVDRLETLLCVGVLPGFPITGVLLVVFVAGVFRRRAGVGGFGGSGFGLGGPPRGAFAGLRFNGAGFGVGETLSTFGGSLGPI